MVKFNRLVLISLLLGSMACKQEMPKTKAINPADLDTTGSPAADFDAYANGGWKKRFPIPAEKSRFGSFDLLADTGEVQVKTLIKEIASKQHEAGSIEQKIADFYNTGMDTAKIEAGGLSPVQGFFDQISAIKNSTDVMNLVADFHVLDGIRCNFKTAFQLSKSWQENFLNNLQVAEISTGQVVHH